MFPVRRRPHRAVFSPLSGDAAVGDDSAAITENEPPAGLGQQGPVNPVIRKKRFGGLHLTLLGQRFLLAAAMLAVTTLLAIVIIAAAFMASDANYERVRELAPIIFTPIVTLLGTSVAWYYASDVKRSGARETPDPDSGESND